MLWSVLFACSSPETPSLTGRIDVVQPDDRARGKRFRGVWFTPADGEKSVVSYTAGPFWEVFHGQQVRLTGEPKIPNGQALVAPHLEVHTLELVEPTPDVPLVRAGPERTFTGQRVVVEGPDGAKARQYSVLQTDDQRWLIAGGFDVLPAPGTPVTVRAREVERSPFVAHITGPTLWILGVVDP